MEELKVSIEIEGEVEQDDRFGIQDAITDALNKLGYEVTKVKVYFGG